MKRSRPSPTALPQWTYAGDWGSAGARHRRRSIAGKLQGIAGKRAEGAQFVKPANLHARPVAEVIKRFSRDWKLMASACAFVSVAMVGVVTLSHQVAVPNTPRRADEPSLRETMTRDDSAERTLKDRAPEPSSAAEDRLGANSEGVGATASAAQANETPESGATQATIGLTNGAPSGSTPEASDPTGPPPPGAARTTFRLQARPRRPDRAATSALGPPEQSLDLKPAPRSRHSQLRLRRPARSRPKAR